MQVLFLFYDAPETETVTTLGLFSQETSGITFRSVCILYHKAPDTDIFAAAYLSV